MQRPVDSTKIKKVAVFPFYNITKARDADKVISNILVAELHKDGRFIVEEPGNIVHFMVAEKVSTVGEIEVDRLKILGRRLGVDAIIVGTIEEYDDGASSGQTPVVSIASRMVDSHEGRLVWSASIKRRGDDYIKVFDIGKARTIAALVQKTVQEMIGSIATVTPAVEAGPRPEETGKTPETDLDREINLEYLEKEIQMQEKQLQEKQ
ncbi:MAG: hypothetical protein AABZ23_04175 [Deltaproteobacteria bacterium]